MSFSKAFCGNSPFQQKKKKKSKAEAKEDYIAKEAGDNVNEESDILEMNAAQDIAGQNYDALSRKEKRNLRNT